MKVGEGHAEDDPLPVGYPLGNILRKKSPDQLPQFINLQKGKICRRGQRQAAPSTRQLNRRQAERIQRVITSLIQHLNLYYFRIIIEIIAKVTRPSFRRKP